MGAGVLGHCLRRGAGFLVLGLAFTGGYGCNDVLGIDDYGPRVEGAVTYCSGQGACPNTADGTPRTCVFASSLGGRDFCAEACDPSTGSQDPSHFACLGTGALVPVCDPAAPDPCPEGFSCFRTDLSRLPQGTYYAAQDLGLCLAVPVCTNHADCSDEPSRDLCAGAILRDQYPGVETILATDHLQCVAACDGPSRTCPEGESCLGALLRDLPDICVPNCDVTPCPPDYFCLRSAGPAYPAICTPGLPGFRCEHPEDCMLGECADTGAGFSLCTISCESNATCQLLNGFRDPSLCVRGHCVTKATFAGALCRAAQDCPSDLADDEGNVVTGQLCSDYDPYHPDVPRNASDLECHRPCNDRCPGLGGMPYVCLPNGECYPADMGLPCRPGDTCMGDLSCLCIDNCDATDAEQVTTCTKACEADSDCQGYSVNPKSCVDGFCRLNPP